jgi:4-alpha-glucanotransferase
MRLTFEVNYHTQVGQEVFLTGAHELFGEWQTDRAIPMDYREGGNWRVTLVIPASGVLPGRFEYGYFVRHADGFWEKDWSKGRQLDLETLRGVDSFIVDSWNAPAFPQNAFLTEPFQRVLLNAAPTEDAESHPGGSHGFRVCAPWIGAEQTLWLSGNCVELGQWNPAHAIALRRAKGEPTFSADVDLSNVRGPVEYKYARRDANGSAFEFETGPNRIATTSKFPTQRMILNDGFPRFPAETWKGAGVAIPVFSLRRRGSFGIGDFGDLKLLADWAVQAGLRMLQILPINDTTASYSWTDSYPYAAISAFALHPIYLDLRQATEMSQRIAVEEPLRQELNALSEIDYERVMKAKLELTREWFTKAHRKLFRTAPFQEFLKVNGDWLRPYSVFSVLRDRFGTAEFSRWPEHPRCEPGLVEAMSKPDHSDYPRVAFYWFVQYQLHLQLEAAARYAHHLGLVIQGDIAIGVNRFGVDTWEHPELYCLDMQAGAPPDAFAVKGQNWGFPTYHWPRMQEDGFAWWRRRFEQMGRYFDAFRIDHILGFFRIWSVPVHAVEGILGYFVPALPVRAEEFNAWGIPFERDRFLLPWINETVVGELLGDLAAEAQQRFLITDAEGRMRLRPDLTTQRQVEAAFADEPGSERNVRLRQGLFDLISNVILLEDGSGSKADFHFRIGMRDTVSFRQLPEVIRERLSALYDDYFFRRQESFWMAEGLRKLPALKEATDMLVCGEDLGMVPACVPEVMRRLGLLCLEVQRMPKRLGQEFSKPKEAQYLAVVTPSTHDMSPIRSWWKEDATVTQRFYNEELGRIGTAPSECTPEVAEGIVMQHLESPAMWSIFQLQDLLALSTELRREDPEAERINIPAVSRYYWRYRMHLNLEDLLQAKAFSQQLRDLLIRSGRNSPPG